MRAHFGARTFLFLLLAAAIGFASPARAAKVTTELRPGLVLIIGDGQLGETCLKARKQIETTTPELLTSWLENLSRIKAPHYWPDFDVDGRLELSADDPELGLLRIHCPFGDTLYFHLVMFPKQPHPGSIIRFQWNMTRLTYQIDGLPALEGSYLEDWLTENGKVKAVLMFDEMVGSEEYRKRNEALLAGLRQGQMLLMTTTLRNGERVSLRFDLTGVGQAIDLLRQKKAESDQVAEGNIQDIKRQLGKNN